MYVILYMVQSKGWSYASWGSCFEVRALFITWPNVSLWPYLTPWKTRWQHYGVTWIIKKRGFKVETATEEEEKREGWDGEMVRRWEGIRNGTNEPKTNIQKGRKWIQPPAETEWSINLDFYLTVVEEESLSYCSLPTLIFNIQDSRPSYCGKHPGLHGSHFNH